MQVQMAEMERYLRKEALSLSSQYARLAVPIGRIAFDHGIAIDRCKSVDKFKAIMTVPNDPRDWVRVLLPPTRNSETSAKPSAYERFCVAHELAHLLLYRRFGFRPADKNTYWHHEGLCDDFARCLLVPEASLQQYHNYDNHLLYLFALQEASQVPVMHVARRISQAKPAVLFMRVTINNAHEYKVSATSFLSGKETGRKIRGLLQIRIASFCSSGRSSRCWNFDGQSLRDSNCKSFDVMKEYRVWAQRSEKLQGIIYLCFEEGSSILTH